MCSTRSQLWPCSRRSGACGSVLDRRLASGTTRASVAGPRRAALGVEEVVEEPVHDVQVVRKREHAAPCHVVVRLQSKHPSEQHERLDRGGQQARSRGGISAKSQQVFGSFRIEVLGGG